MKQWVRIGDTCILLDTLRKLEISEETAYENDERKGDRKPTGRWVLEGWIAYPNGMQLWGSEAAKESWLRTTLLTGDREEVEYALNVISEMLGASIPVPAMSPFEE